MKPRSNRILIVSLVVAVVILGILVYSAWETFQLSYVSTASSCFPGTKEKFEARGFVRLGVFTGNNGNTTVQVFVDPKYEEIHRRVPKREIIHKKQYEQGGTILGCSPLTNTIKYVYGGMNVIQERDIGNQPKVTYTRGLDLSGSFGGAGGIGGLIARTAHGVGGGTAYYHSDVRGNVIAMANAYGLMAKYTCDPFGNTIAATGFLAEANRYRFSSKEVDPGSGLYYYGYRFYEPGIQRWLNEDPIGEAGGLNLYGFVRNNPLNVVDSDGRAWHILGGAAIGGLIGGGVSIVSDLWSGRSIDWNQAAISATEGAIAGTVAAATFGTSLAGSASSLAIRGAAAGLAGDLAAQGSGLYAGTRDCFSVGEAALSTALGSGSPFIAKGIASLFAAKGGTETFEIMDGVRRAKASELLGNQTVPANIFNAESQLIGKGNIPLDALRSPNKAAIDMSTQSAVDRYMSIQNALKQGQTLPPINVMPGTRGVPVKDIIFDATGGAH